MAISKAKFPLTLSFLALLLSSCAADLGKFGKGESGYDELYASLGDVKALYDGGEDDYDVEESLFNDETVNSFAWEDEDDAVKDREYLYLVIPFKAALTIETIAFYLYSETTISLEMSVFYFESELEAPEKIRYLSSPETQIIYDEEDNPIGEEPIVYDDPPKEYASIHGEVALRSGDWVSLGRANFKQQGYEDSYLHADDGGLLYLRVENNSGFNAGILPPVSFQFINLLVRAI
ncbi:MAG: hypothetical protein J6038_00515 [Bacilli bacterium]|nr:hypothetical protein [Bacilli bacterium]